MALATQVDALEALEQKLYLQMKKLIKMCQQTTALIINKTTITYYLQVLGIY
jgi:hypothetical protein